ncbi:MAG: hypothetical protein A2Z21_04155 [Candidatus Fraserbacteria bacterium RBG_16_55_9]|uniref:tRNA (guanine-N(1)-)-methyltransferase C-terminal domain-containing protein n=1 Tax=Fraserbacteria sp. (strain RBG_16_55_9) TaxID=1817864 RepID=A0A1F5UNW4_FRAXR|nr:MAG: hypothetical protein A2Z21_04155 [Candidatus Fraserbacteria bacterium RBG_16_55_9]
MGNLYIGLVHYPVFSREGRVVATAITGLDIHDLARSAHTYGVVHYYVITPLASQREIAERIQRYWLELKEFDPTHRTEALQQVIIVATLGDSLLQVTAKEGVRPLTVGTSARHLSKDQISYEELRKRVEQEREPVYLIFGTGWGLANEVIERVDALLPPILGPGEYNHLSVRAAAAITLDRLRGRRE